MTPRDQRDSGQQSNPQKMAEGAPNYPSGDYSYVLEIVMNMQHAMGKLTEAVESLKIKSDSHGSKLEQIGKDVHAAKVVTAVVGGLIVIAGGVLAWVINTSLQYLIPHGAK